MNPEQELYDWFFVKSLELTTEVYDYLPLEKDPVDYPFIYIGNVKTEGNATITSRGGNYVINIDVWGNREQKIKVSELSDKIYKLAFGEIVTKNFKFYGYPQKQQKQLIQDTSVPNTVFNRGMLTLELDIN